VQCSLECLGGTPLGFKVLRLLLALLGINPLLLLIQPRCARKFTCANPSRSLAFLVLEPLVFKLFAKRFLRAPLLIELRLLLEHGLKLALLADRHAPYVVANSYAVGVGDRSWGWYRSWGRRKSREAWYRSWGWYRSWLARCMLPAAAGSPPLKCLLPRTLHLLCRSPWLRFCWPLPWQQIGASARSGKRLGLGFDVLWGDTSAYHKRWLRLLL